MIEEHRRNARVIYDAGFEEGYEAGFEDAREMIRRRSTFRSRAFEARIYGMMASVATTIILLTILRLINHRF